ncbi:MAG: hypothetical protein Q4F50_00915 [Bacteroides sp.]|uniref:hypothetical protein n=1 Tax=Bacteroides sp. TaxID=29523 RepID=UPI0026DF9629|nr:hypothetical protein [Bacteroides sp.]MDO5418614.1 hypothetical protein [Bacteroides sp.]
MNSMLKYTKVLILLCLGMVVFSSCEQDDETIFDRLIRYGWAGDLGFVDRYGEPLESGLLLNGNGFGTDEQCYFDDPNYIVSSLPLRWMINDGILSLDYGNNYPLIEIYDVYISSDELSGILYVDGYRDGPVTLYAY